MSPLKKITDFKRREPSDFHTEEAPETFPDTCPQPARPDAPPAPALSDVAKGIDDENLRGLAQDRLQEMEESEGNIEDWALAAVDFLDDLRRMSHAYGGADLLLMQQLAAMLQQQLEEHDCELLDSDTWQPSIQRAVKIEITLPPQSEPKIAEKFSSGLRVKGRLSRKQEVHLLKSPSVQ